MHDIMDLESRGIPGGYILTEEFREADLAQARALGFSANKVFVEHPIQDRTDAEMALIAERAFAEVVAMIVTPE
ncbi:hypothetical protein EYC98_05705 [Halieaceae bacterium IMCC14734]|uniref:UGSC-like domain-containing protein n=1 Tax=Candidatus Litorirhabdus singularis TaxID=2518993 RepID=A0ABT3TDH5_9GAMM|nr:hypothetical protein [Candidatus Litorirhabdus singularis]